MELPPATATTLARAIAAYLRDAPANEIPPRLRRFRGFRPQALGPHRDRLIAALDDDDLRGDILEWLDGSPPIKKDEVRLLSIAAGRADGWEEALSATSSPARKPPGKTELERAREAAERERARAAKARDELRSARDTAREEVRTAKQRVADATTEAKELRAELRHVQAETRAARSELERLQRAVEKDKRSLRREADKALTAKGQADARHSALKREVAGLKRRIDELERALADERTKSQRARRAAERAPTARGARRPLKAPKGLLQDAPETLRAWLSSGVRLIVDGYNVGKGRAGFPDVDLETMRNRVVDEVAKLARKHSIQAIVVFDGAEVAPGTGRRSRGPVKIQYSKPPQSADDLIVDLVGSLPPDPVVVATNDRELQGRVAELAATVATSDQLLSLIR